MKIQRHRRGARGYVTLLMVVTTAVVLSAMMLFAYRSAIQSHQVQADVQLYVDYGEKEDAVLRSIVATTPNRAIQTMRDGPWGGEGDDPRSWKGIFAEAMAQANVVRTEGGSGNVGDLIVGEEEAFDIGAPGTLFGSLHGAEGAKNWMTPGMVSSTWHPDGDRVGFPDRLEWREEAGIQQAMRDLDLEYPIISRDKVNLDEAPFREIDYPDINFGYFFVKDGRKKIIARPNWWAFEMDLGARDRERTRVARFPRKFVLSIYEIPSQLAISASAFMSLQGGEWEEAVIEGGIFGGRVQGGAGVDRIALRRGEGDGTTVAVSSESGRVAFVPINRGAQFFDRFGLAEPAPVGGVDTISPTTWDEYSVGAVQCAMRVDVVEVDGVDGEGAPTRIRMSCVGAGGGRIEREYTAEEWNGDGSLPIAVDHVLSGQSAVVLKADLLPAWLEKVGGAGTDINHSVAVNVDYRAEHLGAAYRPNWDPAAGTVSAGRIGLVLRRCSNLTGFTRGFSLVSNLRLYIDDDFNQSNGAGGTPPPCSLFAPEKRFGANEVPLEVEFKGQLGSLKDENRQGADDAINPLVSKGANEAELAVDVNLRPLTSVGELPPITMMNWLVVLEEVR